MLVFGPVPSRRLGQSLGINNIPAKICSYFCVYCQLGRTIRNSIDRQNFYKPERIFREAKRKVNEAREKKESIDFITFVPDGEPTLDAAIAEEITLLRGLGIKIAVITNSSLIYREDVRADLANADLVSFKVDAVSENIWREVDRPNKALKLDEILEGMLKFAKSFKGEIITETMLIDGINDKKIEIEKITNFLAKLKPNKAYIAVPTRPPAEKWVRPASEQIISMAYQIFDEKLSGAEYLIGYEGNAFAFTGNVEEDLLSITSVHPMREEGVNEFLSKANSSWDVIKKLIKEDKLVETEYRGKKFYMRKLPTLYKS